jgi:hypothetical protein
LEQTKEININFGFNEEHKSFGVSGFFFLSINLTSPIVLPLFPWVETIAALKQFFK